MGATTETGFGWATPVLSYAMACVGSALGLRCTVRALDASGRSKRNWLLTAAVSIGAGIWTMHFIAMLGFAVTGTEIRYAVSLTLLSLVIPILFTWAGMLIVGYGRSRTVSLSLGGTVTGFGVVAMHYTGMAAMRLNASLNYNLGTVALSVLIAVAAATAALWAGLTIRGPVAAIGASMIMGVAVTAMHYTGMRAAEVSVAAQTVASGRVPSGGATAMAFILPMIVCLGSTLFLTSAFVALSPTGRQARDADEPDDDDVPPPGRLRPTAERQGSHA
ncbi:MAG TPA: MHYT domain-containing protein [Actinocrinis sp.]|uniref:MHYT domain-containing protein n=1 Tax=Actinocrinis sp. TaxID=1920516 RepID=UPI002D4D103D|nr:MHYT domain-containing protein [Actinocrinis sp.]HZU54653.1 MHYT domain-containing protein [Actinocrinis sp.]